MQVALKRESVRINGHCNSYEQNRHNSHRIACYYYTHVFLSALPEKACIMNTSCASDRTDPLLEQADSLAGEGLCIYG